MKRNKELERTDIEIDRDVDVAFDNPDEITVYIETWFDVDKKFGTDTKGDNDYLNMYARYNPFKDTLKIECDVDKPNEYKYFNYTPTEAEAKLIKDMIAETIKAEYGQTPQEFCERFQNEEQKMS